MKRSGGQSRAAGRTRARTRTTVVVTLVGLLLAMVTARPAAASDTDRIESFAIDYRVETSGVMHVKETIGYRFATSGRHGIERVLVTREPYDDQQDQVYAISNIAVDSPSGAPDEFSTSTVTADHRRSRKEVIRIGDPDETLFDPTATYVITYDVTGALRTSGSYDELYWDATGFDWEATLGQVSITATVPGGAQDVTCYQGEVGSRTGCPVSDVRDGVAVLGAQDLPRGAGVTIGVQLRPGLVANPQPRLERNAAVLSPALRTAARAGAGLGGVLSLVVALLALRWWRRNGRDQHYLGIPPGTLPLPGTTVAVGFDDRSVPVPVAFSPPKIPVAEAGVLLDGDLTTEETAATLVDLAVRGAVRLRRNKSGELSVRREDIDQAQAPHEKALLDRLFANGPTHKLSTSGTLTTAAAAMETALQEQLTAHGWLRERVALKPVVVVGVVAGVVTTVSLIPFGAIAWVGIIPVLGALAFAVVQLFKDSGVAARTADGRAYLDQVQGFRIYLSTAEADQLRFEEGEDIFSRYLPWAIVFDLADRWERICADLVAMGRLSSEPPSWYDSRDGSRPSARRRSPAVSARRPAPRTSAPGAAAAPGRVEAARSPPAVAIPAVGVAEVAGAAGELSVVRVFPPPQPSRKLAGCGRNPVAQLS